MSNRIVLNNTQSMQTISLFGIVNDELAFGSMKGVNVLTVMRKVVEQSSAVSWNVDLSGFRAMDATFARESIAALAKIYSGSRVFRMVNVPDALKNNLAYAAKAKDQLLYIQGEWGSRWVGKKLTPEKRSILKLIQDKKTIRSHQLADLLEIKITAASVYLKKLYNEGCITRTQVNAESGGIEFIYSF